MENRKLEQGFHLRAGRGKRGEECERKEKGEMRYKNGDIMKKEEIN